MYIIHTQHFEILFHLALLVIDNILLICIHILANVSILIIEQLQIL